MIERNKQTLARRRPGFAYVFILMTAMFVAVVGIAGLTIARVEWLADRDTNDLAAARLCAQAAVEMGFFAIATDTNWRTTLGASMWYSGPLGDGTVTLTVAFVLDGDADPSNDDLLLTGIGAQGGAVHKTQVTLTEKNGPLRVVPESWQQQVDP